MKVTGTGLFSAILCDEEPLCLYVFEAMQAGEGQVFGSGMQAMMVNGQAFGRGDKETTGQELGSNAVEFGVNSNGHVTNVRASAHFVADRNQVVGDQGEQFRTDRRGFGTGTFHNEAEGFGFWDAGIPNFTMGQKGGSWMGSGSGKDT